MLGCISYKETAVFPILTTYATELKNKYYIWIKHWNLVLWVGGACADEPSMLHSFMDSNEQMFSLKLINETHGL